VGCGRWGRILLRDLRALDLEVTVADPEPRAREAAREAGAATVPTSDELPHVDGLVVATPATTHADVVSRLLTRGVPLLVEKPLTTSVPDAERLVAEGGDRVFVMHVWRYHPGVRLLARLARRRELGRLLGMKTVRANWRSPRTDVDTVWNMVPHDLSVALAVLGEIPPVRFAQAEVIQGRAVGVWAALGTAPWMTIEASNRYADKRREVRVHFEAGVAVLSGDNGHVAVTRDGDPAVPFDARTDLRPYGGASAVQVALRWFARHLAGGAALPTTAREGLAVVRAVAEIRRTMGLDAST
jgi:predicted dehydrogenase